MMPSDPIYPVSLVWTHTPEFWFQEWTTQTFDYGVADTRGRTIGGYAAISRTKYGFLVRTIGTRDGRKFGPLPGGTHYETLAEAQDVAAEKLEAQRVRYRTRSGVPS